MKFSGGRSFKHLSLICMMAFSLAGCDKASAQNMAYVDVAQVMKGSALGKLEAEHNQKVKEVISKADADAKEKYKSMTAEEQQKNSAADVALLNQLWIAEQQHARAVSVKAITDEAEAYRASHKLDFVIDSGSMLAVDKKNDITPQIIAQLNTKKPDYGDMPKISVADAVKKSN